MSEDDAQPAAQPPPHRTRLSVPAADESTIRWLAQQDNISASVRYLVREHIKREGYTDPTCTPVTRQPRRGRPPGSGTSVGAASAAAHAERERMIALGLGKTLLRLDEHGEAVCTVCGSEYPEHVEQCAGASVARQFFELYALDPQQLPSRDERDDDDDMADEISAEEATAVDAAYEQRHQQDSERAGPLDLDDVDQDGDPEPLPPLHTQITRSTSDTPTSTTNHPSEDTR